MRKVGDIIKAMLGPELAETAQGYSDFFKSWEDITEKNHIAAAGFHSRIKEFEKGVVLIETEHPGWIQLLQTKERKLLYDFQRRFPEKGVTGIAFFLAKEWGETGVSGVETPVVPPPEPSEETEEEKIDDKISWEKIHDEGLKVMLQRLEKAIAVQNHAAGPEELP
ncbi:MAG: DUF721 domain-containing protein [Treponema sp.]|jgi:hypothetical protein|nr:DUF721 domain-containing protein [Treponema sp.]